MPVIITIIALFLLIALFDFEIGLLIAPLLGLLALYFQTRKSLQNQQKQIEQLKLRLGEFEAGDRKDEPVMVSETRTDISQRSAPIQQTELNRQELAADNGPDEDTAIDSASTTADNPWGQSRAAPNAIDRFINRARDLVWSYFTDGNLFVRVGLLILFCGVAFLLKYAAENSLIPVEVRFLGAAAGGTGLLVFGWRIRLHKNLYGLLLQGGGIGIIYITIFASYQLAGLLPSLLTFTLLVFFSLFTVVLAVLQNSRALAIFAVVGGFLAPLLASSGSGNYIGLFSYYTLLNVVIFAVAWFKTWRLLNLIGFAFTFLVYILWFAFNYRQPMLVPASAFLVLFFLMYSLIGIFYALRQPQHLQGLVDGTLVFGTPVVASSILMAMLRHYDYGIAGASALMGIYYLFLARFLWNRGGEKLRLIAEALLAIGVVFATIAIPYSLDGHWSSATWALEAAGILWVSIRQNRIYAQWFAIALQIGAGILFLLTRADDLGQTAWVNPSFLGGVFIALGAFISSRMLYLLPTASKMRLLNIPFFIWAMGWWLFCALMQVEQYVDHKIVAGLILFSGTAAILVYLDRIRNWQWMPASVSAAVLLPILMLLAIASITKNEHVFVSSDILFWIAVLVASYRIIYLLESVEWPNAVNIAAHTAYVVFLACLLSFELTWLTEDSLSAAGNGYVAILTLFPLIFMYLARTARLPAISRYGESLQLSIMLCLSIILALWSLAVNFSQSGDPAPLPYLPLLNPVDIAHIAWFTSLLRSFRQTRSFDSEQKLVAMASFAALAFIWMTAVLVRSLHFYLDIPFDLSTLAADSRVQTAISILWTVIGMAAMLIASKKSIRPAWIVGAALIGVVLIKMLIVDLDASGTVERIVSFLVVGSLLVAMGYFSPIPKKTKDEPVEGQGHA